MKVKRTAKLPRRAGGRYYPKAARHIRLCVAVNACRVGWPNGPAPQSGMYRGQGEAPAPPSPGLPDGSFRADILRLERDDSSSCLQAVCRAGCRLCRYRDGCGFDKSGSSGCRDFTADAGLLGSILANAFPPA